MRPLVRIAGPAVLPVGEPFHRRARVVDLVEVVTLGDVEAPQPEEEPEDDEPHEEKRIKAVEPTARLAEQRVLLPTAGGHRLGHRHAHSDRNRRRHRAAR